MVANGSVSGYDFILKGLTDPPTFNSFKPIGSLNACLGCSCESKTKKNFEAEQFTYDITKPFLVKEECIGKTRTNSFLKRLCFDSLGAIGLLYGSKKRVRFFDRD